MTNPISICSAIVDQINANDNMPDTWSFYSGLKADQNFGYKDDGAEFDYPMIFLDPIKMKAKPNMTNIDEWQVPLSLVFGFTHDMNNGSQAEKEALQQKAMDCARRFYLRLNGYDRDIIKDIGEKEMIVFENVFDIHLCGVSLITSFTLLDFSSTCIT